ncbi:hypothetical protein CCR75_007633 [Bremia lactucae]|uniref:Uncharacterized protein n=1 Tax=Bremia lactucae TaxID=4779 RepID=A0A976IFJ7_BRELC|nr:hypothetical protein CCR75_007633 [Bremia lactucae]
MEGILWTRDGRSKLLRGWDRHYFVLSEASTLQEYTSDKRKKKELLSRLRRPSFESSSFSDRNDLILRQEVNIRGAQIEQLPFLRVNRQHAFQVTIIQNEVCLKLVLCARHADDMAHWITALKSAALQLEIPRHMSSSSPWRSENDSMVSHEDAFLEVTRPQRADMAQLSSVYEWIHDKCVKTSQNVTIAGVYIPRGSLLVSANDVYLETLTSQNVRKLLLEATDTLPISLRFCPSPVKWGTLRIQVATYSASFGKYRPTSRMQWKDHTVELTGNYLTCQVSKRTPSGTLRPCNKNTKRVMVLTSVQKVPELTFDRQDCFLVTTTTSHSWRFQAHSEHDCHAWIQAIQQALAIAHGVLPKHLVLPQTRTSNCCHSTPHWQQTPYSPIRFPPQPVCVPAKNIPTPSCLSNHDVLTLLPHFQRNGRMKEALQLMHQHTTLRQDYWPLIFHYALTYDPNNTTISDLIKRPLSKDDAVQVQKDLPRTSQWLAASANAPQFTPLERTQSLQDLAIILHAFLSSCHTARRTDTTTTSSCPTSFYMQGMNGLAFILLHVLQHDNHDTIVSFLRGIVACILPHVFGICMNPSKFTRCHHFELFHSLPQVGKVFQDVIQTYLPSFAMRLDHAGLPVCLLAYKWFPTLFSDVTLLASQAQLRFETLLCCWDVCFLLGVDGLFCVAVALCCVAEKDLKQLERDASAERVSATLGRVWAELTPGELINHVSHVLDSCTHPVLLKLRKTHLQQLQGDRGTWKEDDVTWKERRELSLMTVTDLDSGNVFQLSFTGTLGLLTT